MIIKSIQFKRGEVADVASLKTLVAEPIIATDSQELYIGTGTGGFPVGTLKGSTDTLEDNLAVFDGDTGRVLKGITKASVIAGLAPETWVTEQINTKVPDIKVKESIKADVAEDANKLGSRAASDYLTSDNITQSYSETAIDKVVSSAGVKALSDVTKATTDSLSAVKLDKADVISVLDSDSITKAASAKALATVNTNAQTAAANALQVATANIAGISEAKAASLANTAKFTKLPTEIFKSPLAPQGSQGVDGDVWLQY